MVSDSKSRMVNSATELFRQHGYSGTGFREINAHSGVAKGAIYHHFPGGKKELALAVIHTVGDTIGDALTTFAPVCTAADLLALFANGWRDHLINTDFQAGCAIVAIVSEAHPEAPEINDAAASAFATWAKPLTKTLVRDGATRRHAERLATLTVAAIEGAVIICRATRSTQPLNNVHRELKEIYSAATIQ